MIAAGNVSTQAISRLRMVAICRPEPLAATAPATPDDSTWVVETGRPTDGLTRLWPTAATLVAIALKSLPFGTIVGMLIYSEPTDPVRLLRLTLIVAGIVGHKLNSPV